MKDKIVIRLTGFPGHSDSLSTGFKLFASYTPKQLRKAKDEAAINNGALAVIEFTPEQDVMSSKWTANAPFRYNRSYYEGDSQLPSFYETKLSSVDQPVNITVAHIGPRAVHNLFKDESIDLKKGEKQAAKTLVPFSQNLNGKKVHLSTSVDSRLMEVKNVLAMIPGKTDEIVVVGAHYDHLGKHGGYIFNGADDNASGSVAVTSIAKAFIASGVQPERSVIFALWTAEEKGLHGSRYFTHHFPKMEKVKMYLNFDMIGRKADWHSKENEVSMIYTKGNTHITSTNQQNLDKYQLDLGIIDGATEKGKAANSDQVNFDAFGVPYFWYHTGGHQHYHQAGDHSNEIMWDKMLRIIKLSYLNIWDFAHNL
ncbi:M20/M25/M40 family metallo-hydrolase [Limibacter armeniacum]|uniref:M28 family metallopeptidase n=1 Tax=Limibacter armeniacum TaxID=466084 RepID=UPI002FE5BBD5